HTAIDEVGAHLGVEPDVLGHRVTRWPRSFPQYLPHHLDRVAAIEGALRRDCPGLVVAGAAYRGVGVPACIRQGREAARAVA
ncbi:MAG: protoporphyrinogen oxidase, partial [Actinomycetota bacterium]